MAKRREDTEHLRKIAEEMRRLVELGERTPMEKLYDQAEKKIVTEEKKEFKEAEKEKVKRAKQLKAATVGKLPGAVSQLAKPFVSTYEKNVMLEAAGAGVPFDVAGAEGLANVTEALYTAAHALELSAIRGTQQVGESLFGSAVEAGIITPEQGIEMFKDVKDGIMEAKRVHAEYSKLVAQEVGGKRGIAGIGDDVMDFGRSLVQNPDLFKDSGRGTE